MNFGDFTDGGNPNAGDYIAGYRTGGGVGSDRRWLRSTFANPPTDDSMALGTTSLKWSDVYLASGAVLNFGSSDVTLTHSTGVTTLVGTMAVTPAAGTAKAFSTTQNISGSPTGVAAWNRIQIDSDNADCSGADAVQGFGLFIQHYTGGSSTKGSRATICAQQLVQTDAATSASNRDYIGINSLVQNNSAMPVTATACSLFAFAGGITADSGSSGIGALVGAEIDISPNVTGIPYAIGWNVVYGGSQAASTRSIGYQVAATATGWKYGFALTNQHGANALASTGTVMALLEAQTVDTIFDFSLATVTTNVFNLPNCTLSGSTSAPTLTVFGSSSAAIVAKANGASITAVYGDASQALVGSIANVPLNLITNNTAKATLSGSVFSPTASDGTALGSTSLEWSDLFLASGGVINWASSNATITHSTGLLTIAGAGLKLLVGTNTIAPLTFQAGTNLSSAADGAMEFDGQALFFSPDASDRRIIPTVAITRLHAANTLADSTTLQKIFNASTNGTVTLPAGSYIFECVVGIDAMSATSGNAALSIVGAGDATVTNLLQVVVGIDGAKATAGAASGASWSVTTDVPAANTSVMTATVSTELAIMWKGSFETTAGTVIPSVDLITGGVTPAVKIGSYFMCWRMGAATDVTQGNWS